ncbi:MAG TPA: sugar ABC transporter permease [Clostridiaceae bacterium]|nr:sugar ABC transporter permease [Clostridiaceae bacterium]
MKKKKFDSFNAFITIIPTSFYLIFVLIPCTLGLILSFTNWKGMSLKFKFIGTHNYIKMFSDPIFYKALINYLYLFFMTSIFMFIIAMFFAIVLSRNTIREKNFFRVLYFFPSTVPMIIIAIMWMVVYNPSIGILNQLLALFGVEPVVWLGNPKTVMPAIVIMIIWRMLGFYMTFYLAGVLSIPQSLYESARIDGASEFRQTFSITIPLLWEVVRTSMVFFVSTCSGIGFQIVYITTRGGPDSASELLTSYMYQFVVEQGNYGYGAALSTAILVVTISIALVILGVTRREVYEF